MEFFESGTVILICHGLNWVVSMNGYGLQKRHLAWWVRFLYFVVVERVVWCGRFGGSVSRTATLVMLLTNFEF